MPNPRRLNDADASFVVMGAATGAPFVPVAITVYAGPYEDPAASEHLTEVMSRLLAAMSLGLRRYHLDHGVKVPELGTLMAISTRAAGAGHSGNDLIAAFLGLPLLDDAETALKACQAVSRARRDDKDVLWLMDRFRAAGNRAPAAVVARQFSRTARGVDLSLSNVKGMPVRNWIAGVEALETAPFLIGGPALAATLVSGPTHATLGLVTCPEAVRDPEHLVARLEQAFGEVIGIGRS